MKLRKIIHIDMDSFFASVEQRDFPHFEGKPLVVGGRSARSVVAAASYEARKYGVRSAMPMLTALKRCPHLIVQSPRFDVYKKVSTSIRHIFHTYTDWVEPLSLDEAYLDVTNPKKGPQSASLIARQIKNDIFEKENLIASAGVSYNKSLAKIASDMDKPDGFFLILPEEAEALLESLDIGLLYGVGKKTKEKMHRMNIFKGSDLKQYSRLELQRYFGKSGGYFYDLVRGIDERPVMPFREHKSIGAEKTFLEDIYDFNLLTDRLEQIIDLVWERTLTKAAKGKTMSLKLRYADFTTITRAYTHNKALSKASIKENAIALLPKEDVETKGVRLLGVSISNFFSRYKKRPFQMTFDF